MIKFKLIFLPFIFTFIGVISSYTALRWLIEVKYELISIDETVLDVYFPVLISIISILFVMRKRLRVFEFTNENSSYRVKIIMLLGLAIPFFISQLIIFSASYNIVNLRSIKSLPTFKNEKFIGLENFHVTPSLAVSDVSLRVTGRYDETLYMSLFKAVPIDLEINVWYGIEYSERINNGLAEDKKNNKIREFIEDSEAKFKKTNYYNDSYFELLRKSELRDGLKRAIDKKYPHKKSNAVYILYPRNIGFEQRNDGKLEALILFIILALLAVQVILMNSQINEQSLARYKNNELDENDTISEIIKVLSLKTGSPVTAISINLCILAFLFSVFVGVHPIFPTIQEIILVGGVRRDLVISGEYWRLVSAVFLHAGFVHLLLNSAVLAIAGRILEPAIGSYKFALVFTFSGIAASLASISWHYSAVSVGASGAIYGVIGALIVLSISGFIDKSKKVIVWLIAGLVIVSGVIMGLYSNIGHAAHIGGFVAGLLSASILIKWLKVIDLKE